MWETSDPDGRRVVLSEERWRHIVRRHSELEAHRERTLEAIETPTRRTHGHAANEEWFFLEGAGPSRWLQVVVHYEESRGSVTTAFGRGRPRWR